ncbi:MAG TPA: hypothetical protein VH234_03290 [Candidatus Saccharimonadales bacterium]|jgi:hypothetical protein|nr:hypothetical protein [Candidatus Saccharimonadales bacterium]
MENLAVAAAPNQHLTLVEDIETGPPVLPLVFESTRLDVEELVRHRSDRFIGEALVGHEVVVSSELKTEDRNDSLRDAIHRGAAGDPVADALCEDSIIADVGERIIKVGDVTKVLEVITDSNETHQHGQTGRQRQANALRSAGGWQMLGRFGANARNFFRIDTYRMMGLLEDYRAIVFELMPRDIMTTKELDKNHFFTKTMSISVQSTTVEEGALEIETALVAGVKKPGAEPHDVEMVDSTVESWGLDWKGKTTTEKINIVVLVHKSLTPNGIIDIVKHMDDLNGGTFFGEDRPRQSYLEYLEFCRERKAAFWPKVQAIKAELYSRKAEATTDPAGAELLDEISEKHMVEKAVEDISIDPMVFGPVSAVQIVEARHYKAIGNYERACLATQEAIENADSGACNGIKKKGRRSRRKHGLDSDFDDLSFNFGEDESNNDDESGVCKETKDGDEKKCPECKKKVKAIVPKKGGTIYCDQKGCKLEAPEWLIEARIRNNATTKKRWIYSIT